MVKDSKTRTKIMKMNKEPVEIIETCINEIIGNRRFSDGPARDDAHVYITKAVLKAIKEAGYAIVPIKTIKETEINERLIAAAPDLLEALKSSLELIYFTPDGGSGVVIDQINDAITKATGG